MVRIKVFLQQLNRDKPCQTVGNVSMRFYHHAYDHFLKKNKMSIIIVELLEINHVIHILL